MNLSAGLLAGRSASQHRRPHEILSKPLYNYWAQQQGRLNNAPWVLLPSGEQRKICHKRQTTEDITHIFPTGPQCGPDTQPSAATAHRDEKSAAQMIGRRRAGSTTASDAFVYLHLAVRGVVELEILTLFGVPNKNKFLSRKPFS